MANHSAFVVRSIDELEPEADEREAACPAKVWLQDVASAPGSALSVRLPSASGRAAR